jgi:hypothetical protein
MSVAVNYCNDKARDLWDSREVLLKMKGPGETEEPVITFEHFQTAMIAAYGNLDPIMVAWIEYENLKQGKMSVEEYARQVETPVAKLGMEGLSEMDTILRFKAGIHPDMRQKVATRLDGSCWTSFPELVKFASGVWTAMKQAPAAPSESRVPRSFGGKKHKQNRAEGLGGKTAAKGGSKKQ